MLSRETALAYPSNKELISESSKFSLTLKEPPMTIIAAMRETPESILIAVDSQQTEMPGGIRISTDTKLQQHPTLPLAWGVAYNASIGTQFSEWARSYPLTSSTDWFTLQGQFAECLSRLNGTQRALSGLAGVRDLPPEALCSILVVGYLGTVGKIFEIDPMGLLSVLPDDQEFCAIGSGKVLAYVAHRTLTRIPSEATAEERLKTIVDITAEIEQHCGPPVRWGRVTPDSFIFLG
jgi:hypothetical protein